MAVRKNLLQGMALAALLAIGSPANAQSSYPDKPIRLVVGFPAGSAVDLVARLIAPKLAEGLGTPVVIENIPGAAGNLAADRVTKAAPDGHTLAFAANAQIIMNPSLYRLAFDPVKDFSPISQLISLPNILVIPETVTIKSFPELIALAKARPGELTYASGGVGGSPHLAGALLSSVAGIDIRHIPYKGAIAAMPDLLAARVSMMFSPTSIVLSAIREGRLRALAVTSLSRSSTVPDVPTIAESGFPGFNVTVWLGLLAPAGTQEEIVGRLHRESVKALSLRDVRERLGGLGMEVIGNSPAEFAAVIRSELPTWAKVIKDAGISPEH
jgi:tripartite-type tricarboxylate transporter receptor subunit TctC